MKSRMNSLSVSTILEMRASTLLLLLTTIGGQEQFLNAVDFYNANFVDTMQLAHISINDQRFSLKRKKRSSAVYFNSDKWPNGRIPYVISAAYTLPQRATIARAIAAYTARTCIRFTPRQPYDNDYIIISKTGGCFADFARVGGPQQVSLADECLSYATAIHELMHVIGFIHEHQRNDRDYFVNILWQNIIPGEFFPVIHWHPQ